MAKKKSTKSREDKNLKIIKNKCKHYLEVEKKPLLITILAAIARKLADYIEKDARIPEYSSNLRDATGVGVYVNGALTSYVPTKKATKKQKSGFHYRNEYGIDGSEYLLQAISSAATSFSRGIWIVLFSAVPYAYFLNKPELVENLRGKVEGNFYGEISDRLIAEIYSGLVPLKPKQIPVIARHESI